MPDKPGWKYVPIDDPEVTEKPETTASKYFRMYNTPISDLIYGAGNAEERSHPKLKDLGDENNFTERMSKKIAGLAVGHVFPRMSAENVKHFGEKITSFLPFTKAKREGFQGMLTPATSAQIASIGTGPVAMVANAAVMAEGVKNMTDTSKTTGDRLLGAVGTLGGGVGSAVALRQIRELGKVKAAANALKTTKSYAIQTGAHAEPFTTITGTGKPIAVKPESTLVTRGTKIPYGASKPELSKGAVAAAKVAAKKTRDEAASDIRTWRNLESWKTKVAAQKAKVAAEAKKVAENEAKLTAIEAAKAGRVPTSPSISEGLSATTPGGGRASMSKRFVEPKPPEGAEPTIGGSDAGPAGPAGVTGYTTYGTKEAAAEAAMKTGGIGVETLGRGHHRVIYPDTNVVPAGTGVPLPGVDLRPMGRSIDLPPAGSPAATGSPTAAPVSPEPPRISSVTPDVPPPVPTPATPPVIPPPPKSIKIGKAEFTPAEAGRYIKIRPQHGVEQNPEDLAEYLAFQRRVNGESPLDPTAPAAPVTPPVVPKGPTPVGVEPEPDFPFGANEPAAAPVAPPVVPPVAPAAVKFMVTNADRAALRARGLTPAQYDKMTPDEVAEILATPAAAPPPVVAPITPDVAPIAPTPPVVAPKKVTAKYLGEQPGLPAGEGYPEIPSISLYNIDGGPSHGSTVSAETLRSMGIDVPPTGPVVPKPVVPESVVPATALKPKTLVKLQIPGPNGPMNVAGTVDRVLPNGKVEVRLQQGGIHTVDASELTPVASAQGGVIPARGTANPELQAKIEAMQADLDGLQPPPAAESRGLPAAGSVGPEASPGIQELIRKLQSDLDTLPPEPTVPTRKTRGVVPVAKLSKEDRIARARATYSAEANAELDRLRIEYDAATDPALKHGPGSLGDRMSKISRDEKARLLAESAAASPAAQQAQGGLSFGSFDGMSPDDQLKALADLSAKAKANGPKGGSVVSMFGGGQLEAMGKIMAENPAFTRAITTVAGAGTGAAIDDDDPFVGALVGAGVGFGSATLLNHINKARIAMASGASQKATPAVAMKFKEIIDTAAWMLPDFQRFALLSKLGPLAMNSLLGPWGAVIMHGIEDAAHLDPRGLKLLKLAWNPMSFTKGWFKSIPAAKKLIGDTAERTEGGLGQHGPEWYRTFTQYPGVAMTAGDEYARSLAKLAGYTDEEARAITLTSEPYTSGGASVSKMKKGAVNRETGKRGWWIDMSLPFYRTNMNQIEQGMERTPLYGIWMHLYGKKLTANGTITASWGKILAQQVMGGSTFAASVMIGEKTPTEDAKHVMKFLNNFGGQYGAIMTAGFVVGQAHARGISDWKALTRELATELPMPSAAPITDALGLVGTATGLGDPPSDVAKESGVWVGDYKIPSGFVPGILDPSDPVTSLALGAIRSTSKRTPGSGGSGGTAAKPASTWKYVPVE